MSTGHTSQEAEVEEQERCCQAPVDITGPVDFTVDMLKGIRNMVMLMANLDVVDRNTGASSHSKVRKSCSDGDDGGDDMVEAFSL